MDSEIILNHNIYKILYSEYTVSECNYALFIERKDMGIISIDLTGDFYKVVDEKKWLLSKLKYGF
jgi:hypothetical protein